MFLVILIAAALVFLAKKPATAAPERDAPGSGIEDTFFPASLSTFVPASTNSQPASTPVGSSPENPYQCVSDANKKQKHPFACEFGTGPFQGVQYRKPSATFVKSLTEVKMAQAEAKQQRRKFTFHNNPKEDIYYVNPDDVKTIGGLIY